MRACATSRAIVVHVLLQAASTGVQGLRRIVRALFCSSCVDMWGLRATAALLRPGPQRKSRFCQMTPRQMSCHIETCPLSKRPRCRSLSSWRSSFRRCGNAAFKASSWLLVFGPSEAVPAGPSRSRGCMTGSGRTRQTDSPDRDWSDVLRPMSASSPFLAGSNVDLFDRKTSTCGCR